MIDITNIQVFNFENAIRGMRNSYNSWNKSDSHYHYNETQYNIGKNDLQLMKKLIKTGHSHSKFLRQIFVSFDINAPLYWYKEMDQYKVGTTTNSCSTMHTLSKRELNESDFSWDIVTTQREKLLEYLNFLIQQYNDIPTEENFRTLIQDLPSSFNQKRTWTGSYENIRNIYVDRHFHKLKEWRDFCNVIETKFPYAKELIV